MMGILPPTVSVIICTYSDDRRDSLYRAVTSIRGSLYPAHEIVVVVDHNRDLYDRIKSDLVGVIVTENEEPRGLSGARNTGVRTATGSLIAFLDDDACAEPEWLSRLASWCQKPDVLGASGMATPVWSAGMPRWFPDEFLWVVGCSYRGLPTEPMWIRNLFGGCACFRREVFDRVGLFRTDLGRIGGNLEGAEETELCIRARRLWASSGFQYDPHAVIQHAVPPPRATWRYFLRRCYQEGRSKARLVEIVGEVRSLTSERHYTLHTLPTGVLRDLYDVIRGRPEGLLRAGAIAAGFVATGTGYIYEYARKRYWTLKQSVGTDTGLTSLPPSDSETAGAPANGCASPAPLRVLLVTPRYFPFTGGIETHVHEVGSRLVERGLDVTVLTTDPTGKLPPTEEVRGMRVRRVRGWPAGADYYFAPGMYDVIASGHWDVLHCQGIHTLVPPLAMAAAIRHKIPYLLTFHTGGHSSRLRHKLRNIQWKALRPLLVRASALIGVSQFEAQLFQGLLNLPADKVSVIQNGGRLPEPSGHAPRDPSQPLILSIGRLEAYKGHQRVIAALPHLQAYYPNIRLRIVGTGPYRTELLTLAHRLGVGDKVHIEGIPPSDRAAMGELIASAALVTLLSEYEAHPVAVMEALALQRPVVVAANSGLRELAEQGLARAVDVDSDSGDVAAVMLQQLQDPLVPSVTEIPTWERCVDQLLVLYIRATRRLPCAS